MAESFKPRVARLADVAQLLVMMRTFNRAESVVWRPRRVAPALRRLLHEPRLGLVVVIDGPKRGSLAGYAIGTFGYDLEFAGPDGFVTELFVRPAHRARGEGRRLLDALTERLRAEGAGAVHLLVWPENHGARRLYARAGFAEVRRLVMTKALAIAPPPKRGVARRRRPR